MTVGNERQQRVAASFARQYYTLMVQMPERLPSFYTQNASFNHMGHKATDIMEIEDAVSKLYPMQADASVKIQSLTTQTDGDGHIHVMIKGSITTPPGMSQEFIHLVELMEHESHPGSFGIVSDKRENTFGEEAPRRWALETPPMFAKEPAHGIMEQIEQPVSTTEMATIENATTKKDVEKLEKAESLASAKDASPVPAAGTTVPTTSQSQASKDVEKTTDKADPSVPATTTEVKKPKSFAEAIMMSKRVGPSQGQKTLLTVLAKESREPTALTPAKEKKKAVARPVEKNGTKTVPKNGVNKKTAGTPVPANDGKKNGKALATGSNRKSNNSNEANNKRKDADGRALSRFVVFYDIIVKGLPTDATEKTVRDIVDPTAPTKLIKVLSRTDKKDPNVMRTFAFVQLDHNAIKEAGDDVKAAVAKVLAAHKGKKSVAGHRIQIDEVREKYTAAPKDVAVDVSA
ncbi:hypothetical protein TcYC6_0115450 [Trypanosoma cruzi]|nr:hypothetical protein TcYC6_0115450 [Trypanosoma cruzi]